MCDATLLNTTDNINSINYDWIVMDESGKPLAYKQANEDPVFIDAEKAVLKCIETITPFTKMDFPTT